MSERIEEPRDPEGGPDPWRDEPRWSESEPDSPIDPATSSAVDSPADPWADAPAWSDGSANPAPVPEAATEPEAANAQAASGDEPATCPWCATPAAPGATKCSSCGAALAQRESIGDLVIPGLTAVDPALQDFADRPLHLTGPSPTHGVASGVVAAAAMGGPMGIAILGGVAAVGAAEYLGADRRRPGWRAGRPGRAGQRRRARSGREARARRGAPDRGFDHALARRGHRCPRPRAGHRGGDSRWRRLTRSARCSAPSRCSRP